MSKSMPRTGRPTAGVTAGSRDGTYLAERRVAELQNATAHHRAGRLKEAEAGYRLLLLGDPNQAPVVRSLGSIMMSRGEVVMAVSLFERAIRLCPELVEAHVGFGDALAAHGKLSEAEVAYQHALKLDPKNLEALNNLGNLLQARRRFAEAVAVFQQAVAVNPALAELHNNLGNALQAEKRTDEAIQAFREAIALNPDFPEAHSNLGNMLKVRNQLPEAIASYRRAIELSPRYVDALNNLGNALRAQGLSTDAIAAYQQSQALHPTQGDAYFYESLVHLSCGNLTEGFAKYEYRWKSELRMARRACPQPVWLGTPDLKGRTLLLHAEQGLGDTLQFVRYATLAAERGATVFLEVQPALKALLTGFPGVQAMFAKGEPLPAFELHCPLLSLPHAFRTTLATIPAPGAYLTASPERLERWRNRLPRGLRPRVGLVWSGNLHHKNDGNRSVPLSLLRPLLEWGGADFYSLQKDYRSDDERRLASSLGITDLAAELVDFEDTAAAVSQLNLVISVDTSVAHLAGALGRPTWVLLPNNPDWRWLLQRADSPWYPSMRLFRQERAGDWTKPIEAMVAACSRLVVG